MSILEEEQSEINKFGLFDSFNKCINIITAWTLENSGGGVSISVKNTINCLKKMGWDVNLPLEYNVDSWNKLESRIEINKSLTLNNYNPCLCIDIDGFSIKGIRCGGNNLKIVHVRTNFLDISKYEKGKVKKVCNELSEYLLQNILTCDVLFFSSKYTYDCLSEYIPKQVVSYLMPNGVDPILAEQARIMNNTYKEGRIVAMGSFYSRKCFSVLIEASKYIFEQGIEHELIIVGEGPEEADLIKRINKYKHITIQPFLKKRKEVTSMLISAQIACHPAVQEDFGNLYIEAGVVKRPIVAAKSGAALEHIFDGQNGLFFEANNWRDLADKLTFLLNNPDDCKNMGKKGYELSQNYKWEYYSKKLINIINYYSNLSEERVSLY